MSTLHKEARPGSFIRAMREHNARDAVEWVVYVAASKRATYHNEDDTFAMKSFCESLLSDMFVQAMQVFPILQALWLVPRTVCPMPLLRLMNSV